MTPCRACGSDRLTSILDLGATPLANRLLTAAQLDEPEPTYALHLMRCNTCAMVQITETVPPEELFSHYLYFSSFSDTMVEHARQLAHRLIDQRKLNTQSLAVELASNDGYLLQHYRNDGVPVLGIEPAKNIAAVAQQRGIETLCAFFDEAVARELDEQADVIHANNVLAHVADLNSFVAGIAQLLKRDGVAVIEAPYLRDMIDGVEFDTIYHEHLCYLALTPMQTLFAKHGLTIIDVEHLPIHGGSLRYFAAHEGTPSEAVNNLIAEEAALDDVWFSAFSKRVATLKADLLALLHNLSAEGATIAAYGASAKGSTLLNYLGIDAELIDYVVDRSTHKQGMVTPGSHLPIYPPEVLLERQPDYVLLLTWNFRDEILQQQQAYRVAGGQFIVPIPTIEVV